MDAKVVNGNPSSESTLIAADRGALGRRGSVPQCRRAPASRLCLAIVVIISTGGCSARSFGRSPQSMPADTVALDVANATSGDFSKDSEKESEAIHNFLVAQLSLGQEDFEGALRHFEKADALSDEPSAIIHTKLADLYLRFGELEKARVAAEKAMAADPSEPYVRMLYAGVLEGLGREQEAEPIYQALVNEFPAKIDGYLLLANLYIKQKKNDAAVSVLTKLIQHQPEEPIGHFYLGRMYEQMEMLDKAEVQYRWVFERDPNLSNGSTELLRVLVRQKKNSKVKDVCERMLQKDPNNALARKVLSHVMLGESKLDDALQHLTILEGLEGDPSETRFKVALIQMEKQNFREATRELSLVLAKNPKHAEARYYLASIYAGSGKRKEAIDELSSIEKESPMFVKARTFAAFILRQDEELRAALDAIDEALEIEPDNINLVLYRVLILRDLDENAEAERQLRGVLEKYPNDERLLFNLGLVLHDREKEREAVQVMEALITINPKNSDALNYVAYAIAEEGGDLTRADTLARQALEVRPNDGYYLDTLGFIQWKRGRVQDAEETLSRAVSATGDDSVIVEHYVDVLLELHQEEKAVSVLKAFCEQDVGDENDEPEKVEARKRLNRKLEELLRKHPEFQGVQKSHLIPLARARRAQSHQGVDFLELVNQGDGAS